MNNPALLILTCIPLAGSLVVFSLREAQAKLAKQLSLAVSLVVLIYTIVVLFEFKTNGSRFQFVGSWDWIKAFGVHIAFGADGIANGVGAGFGGGSARLRRMQTGFVRSYALSMLGGSVAVVAVLLAVRFQ